MFDKSTPSKNLLNTDCDIYQEIAKIAQEMRSNEPLRFGRMYYRQISGDGENFGFPFGSQYTLAFSRLLYGEEVLIAYNVSGTPRNDFLIVDAAYKTGTIWRRKIPLLPRRFATRAAWRQCRH